MLFLLLQEQKQERRDAGRKLRKRDMNKKKCRSLVEGSDLSRFRRNERAQEIWQIFSGSVGVLKSLDKVKGDVDNYPRYSTR